MVSSGTRLRASRPCSVLVCIVDDALRTAVVDLLGEEGWLVREATNLEDARAAIAAAHPSVLVVDPGLCTADLETFVASLDDRNSAPAVVVLSDLGSAAETARTHHVVFLREPFDLDELLQAVERAREEDARPSLGRREVV